jgi:diguanylate cyclase (GGDEF)-like protein
MISLKKYLDTVQAVLDDPIEVDGEDVLTAAIAAYGAALIEMGHCGVEACPGEGQDLRLRLGELKAGLSPQMDATALTAAQARVSELLQDWGSRAAKHYRQKAGEVKELLIVMAQAAESVGVRDQRCAGQITEVTARLKEIASLDDLTQIRASIEKSAVELKTSIDRMAHEGKAAIDQLRAQVVTCRARLEEAEEIACRDTLTGARSRLGIETVIEARIVTATRFCVAMVDIDDFKVVNDQHGHLMGDELLKQFAAELRSTCRPADVIGRWGGDEFIVLFDCALDEAGVLKERILKWACGSYSIGASSGSIKLNIDASIGLAEHQPGEPMKDLLARADAEMYAHKARSSSAGSRR